MKLIVTIDGPAGSGKSTVAKRLAQSLHLPYIDTGSMYRCVAWKALQQGIALDDEEALLRIAEPLQFLFESSPQGFVIKLKEPGGDFKALSNEIRTPEVSLASSTVATLPRLRACLVRKQQEFGRRDGGVLEGRDAGTVIFPEAPLKFFLTASPEVRASRRHLELSSRMGSKVPPLAKVLEEVKLRDEQDMNRAASPLRMAEGARLVDTSSLEEDQVFDTLLSLIQKFKMSS